ncbi:MAG: plastocyanin [Paucimonas sp.]|nr:plastocyanin [Paucimonas sp.]
MKPVSKILLVLPLVTASGLAASHGNGSAHSAPKKAEAVSQEERSFGRQGDLKDAVRVVKVEMGDNMRFTPSSVTIDQGETVRFIVTNGATPCTRWCWARWPN